MRNILLYAGLGLAVLGSCSKSYDDAPLKGRVEAIDKRIAALEARLKTYNDELATLEQVLQAGRHVTKLEEIEQRGKVLAYELTMSDGKTLYIPLGEQGRAGKGITMGVQQDASDNKYYWTVDSEWLRDSRGNRVPLYDTEQTEGIKGFTPKLEIRDGAWQVQVREGEWTRLNYPIQGPQGDPGDVLPGLVRSIAPAADQWSYELHLTDGSVIQLPRAALSRLIFANTPNSGSSFLENGRKHRLPFTIKNPIPDLIVELVCSSRALMRIVWTNAEKTEGYVEVEPLIYSDHMLGESRAVTFTVYLLRGNRELITSFVAGFQVKKVVEE